MRTPHPQATAEPIPWVILASRSILFAAAFLVLWIAVQQPRTDNTLNDAPDVTTHTATHVCGSHTCAPATR